MTEQSSVLIAGAGPAGLILAHELLRRQVPIRLIEKRQGPSSSTRAMTVHARTMEMFEHMGLARRLEEVCLECPGNMYHFPHLALDQQPRTDFRKLPSRYAFYYKINQNDLEQVLREHLFATYSLVPEYRTELVGLELESDKVRTEVRSPAGDVEKHSHPWVVGCDGVRSFVRTAANIPFPGKRVGVMAMMDVALTGITFDDTWMNYFFNRDLFLNATKIPGPYWRVYMSEPSGELVNSTNPRAAFQEVSDRIGVGLQFGEPQWSTAWEIVNNVAERYREGRALICGDASHVHSPAGGQGMNGCMQDAFNLGWKLSAVYRGTSVPKILDSYEAERKPIGEQIGQGAQATHKIVMGFGTELADRFPLTQVEGWEERTSWLVSGLAHSYRNAVTVPDGLTPVAGPQPGDRAPDAVLVKDPKKRVYDVLRHPRFTLLVFPGEDMAASIEAGRGLATQLERQYPGQVVTHLIGTTTESWFDFDHRTADETGEVRLAYGLDTRARLVLVRPDLYIGMNCLQSEGGKISDYLRQWMEPAR